MITIVIVLLIIIILLGYSCDDTDKGGEEVIQRMLDEAKKEYEIKLQKEKDKILKSSKAVIRGKISEEIVPLLPNFPYKIEDCRFSGQPVDYIIYDGMSEFRDGNTEKEITIILMDVKTGSASRSKVQNAIKKAIETGRIKFETLKV